MGPYEKANTIQTRDVKYWRKSKDRYITGGFRNRLKLFPCVKKGKPAVKNKKNRNQEV
jgi:hypothetical protein